MVSLGRIDAEIARQRKAQREAQTRAAAQAKQTAQALLEKYDRNHDGVINLEEKEPALDDPIFIKSDLDKIDANHNGILDPEELAYFDANQNKILDPKEQAGIDIAQHLLAERLLKKYDANRDGFLDFDEFTDLREALGIDFGFGPEGDPTFLRADKNHDRAIDLEELEAFLKQQTLKRLQPRRMPEQPPVFPRRPPFFNPMGNKSSVNPQHSFKSAVESFWKNPDSVTNRLPHVQGRGPINRGANP